MNKIKLFIKTSLGDTFEIEVNYDIDFIELRKIIEEEKGVHFYKQKLYFKQTLLTEQKLVDFFLSDGETLILHIRDYVNCKNNDNEKCIIYSCKDDIFLCSKCGDEAIKKEGNIKFNFINIDEIVLQFTDMNYGEDEKWKIKENFLSNIETSMKVKEIYNEEINKLDKELKELEYRKNKLIEYNSVITKIETFKNHSIIESSYYNNILKLMLENKPRKILTKDDVIRINKEIQNIRVTSDISMTIRDVYSEFKVENIVYYHSDFLPLFMQLIIDLQNRLFTYNDFIETFELRLALLYGHFSTDGCKILEILKEYKDKNYFY